MHLTREQVGQVTGMTGVHASRTWSYLVADSLISKALRLERYRLSPIRHCEERSDEAIQRAQRPLWIASLRSQ
jgi:hypothetical protein